MTGHEPPPELKEDEHRKPIFARSCRSAQSGYPTAPREVHLPLLPHGPSGVRRHLPRRTRLRRSAGPEENRPVPLTSHHCLSYPKIATYKQRNTLILLLWLAIVKQNSAKTTRSATHAKQGYAHASH